MTKLVAAFPDMLRRDRERWGMRECQAAWRFGISVREYRELEAGERSPTFETWDRICKLFGWPHTFVGGARHAGSTATKNCRIDF